MISSRYPVIKNRKIGRAAKLLSAGARMLRMDPKIDLADLLDIPSDQIFIFDDLERCRADPGVVLGFISQILTEYKNKVIILSNESEIDQSEQYLRNKEKVIGWKFKFSPRFEQAISHFVSRLDASRSDGFYTGNIDLIKEIYIHSDSGNLRIIEQSLYDFDRLLNDLPTSALDHQPALAALFQICLIGLIETRGNVLHRDDIKLRVISTSYDTENGHVVSKITGKYSSVDFRSDIISSENLEKFLFDGDVNPDGIVLDINRSLEFLKNEHSNDGLISADALVSEESEEIPPQPTEMGASAPLWKRYISYFTTDYSVWITYAKQIDERLARLKFTVPGEILHIFALKLFLAKNQVVDVSEDDVVASAKNYIDDLLKIDKLLPISIHTDEVEWYASWEGFAYVDSRNAKFQEIENHLLEMQRQALRKQYPMRLAALLELLRVSPSGFARSISSVDSEISYARVPIFTELPVEGLVEKIIEIGAEAQREIFGGFYKRYNQSNAVEHLIDEADWAKSLDSTIQIEAKKLSKLERFRVTHEWNRVAERISKFDVAARAALAAPK